MERAGHAALKRRPARSIGRGAASPAFGLRQNFPTSPAAMGGSDEEEDEEEGGTGDGGMPRGDAAAPAARLRPAEYAASAAPWDGVRWCLEAHLRRAARRRARRARRREEEEEARRPSSPARRSGAGADADADADHERAMASVRIASPAPPSAAAGRKRPAKRKIAPTVASRPGSPDEASPDDGDAAARRRRARAAARRAKYGSPGDYQDCCYDPLLGAGKRSAAMVVLPMPLCTHAPLFLPMWVRTYAPLWQSTTLSTPAPARRACPTTVSTRRRR